MHPRYDSQGSCSARTNVEAKFRPTHMASSEEIQQGQSKPNKERGEDRDTLKNGEMLCD
jgi:hypothetical protein